MQDDYDKDKFEKFEKKVYMAVLKKFEEFRDSFYANSLQKIRDHFQKYTGIKLSHDDAI